MTDAMSGAIAILINIVVWTVFITSWVRILHRMGLSGWWLLTIGLWPIMIWVLSRCRWPAFDEKQN